MSSRIELEVTGRSHVELHPLRMRREADEMIVGRPVTGSYLALSSGAFAAAKLLSDGHSIVEAKAALAKQHGDQEIRLLPLLEALLAAGLVKALDNAPLPEPLAPRRYHLTWLQRRHVAWVSSRPAAALYLSLVGVALTIVLADPRYLPRPADAIAVPAPIINLTLVWGVSMIALAAHELAHLVAATSLGVRAGFSLGNRLVFPVAQTDLTDLWLVDRRRRYLAYAAGMLNDVLLASAALVALWLHDRSLLPFPHLLYRILRLAVLVLALGLLWQFNVYLRTDVYYLIANLTGCRSLSGDALSYLKAKLRGLVGRAEPDPLSSVPERERPLVRWFAALMVVGSAGVLVLAALYLGALLWVLLGGTDGRAAGRQVPQVSGQTLAPILVSLALTCCWLACALLARRRRRALVQYRLVAPEDL